MQLHSLLCGQNVYVAPFSIMHDSLHHDSCYFDCFQTWQDLFTDRETWSAAVFCCFFCFLSHDDGSTAGEQGWKRKYHEGRGAFTHAASVFWNLNLISRLTVCSPEGNLPSAPVALLAFFSNLQNKFCCLFYAAWQYPHQYIQQLKRCETMWTMWPFLKLDPACTHSLT